MITYAEARKKLLDAAYSELGPTCAEADRWIEIVESHHRLDPSEVDEIHEILKRRANEVAGFYDEYRADPKHFGSVELALSREIDRLRALAERLNETHQ